MLYYVPILVIVVANTFYQVAAKEMPSGGNTFAYLMWVYITAAVLSVILFFLTGSNNDLFAQMKEVNYAPFLLGAAIVALEYGFILLYKVGWEISLGSTVCNILLALVMIAVGLLIYKEHISMYNLAGILLCMAGLYFINK